MIACVTAEEYQPENVEHTERDASYKSLLRLSRSLSLTVQLIVRQVKASADKNTQTLPRVWVFRKLPGLICVCVARGSRVWTRQRASLWPPVELTFRFRQRWCARSCERKQAALHTGENTRGIFRVINTRLALFEKKYLHSILHKRYSEFTHTY